MSDLGVARVAPVPTPPRVTVRVPGSKSITNRALLCGALASGESSLSGALLADDTRAMIDAVGVLGAHVEVDQAEHRVTVRGAGTGTAHGAEPRRVDARQSGTTSRFILAAAALGDATLIVDGDAQLRARPFGALIEALLALGAQIESLGAPGCLPLSVRGPARGGAVRVPGHISSQFLSGLLMAGPLMEHGVQIELSTPLVSAPYLKMTAAVMRAFGVAAEDGLRVGPGAYRACSLRIEPDATAASYFFAAAAITGGEVTIPGLDRDSIQGDIAFVDVLERMGARVEWAAGSTTVRGSGDLHGVDVDLGEISDTAQTLAAVAVFASTPTRVRGVGFIRGKETDRIRAMVTELRRAGLRAQEHDDGFTVHPGAPLPTRFATYDDHRMAMSLALLGLREPGIEIADPGCVAKTYPDFFSDLAALARC